MASTLRLIKYKIHSTFIIEIELALKRLELQASAVAKWITEGAKPGKIVLGIAAYGRSFELADVNKIDPGSPINGSAPPGLITDERGVLSYFEVKFLLFK